MHFDCFWILVHQVCHNNITLIIRCSYLVVVFSVKNEALYLVFPVLCSHYLARYVKRWGGNDYCNSRRLKAVMNYVSTGALSQPFSPASGSVCPGSDIEFTCVGNSILVSSTRWEITPDGGEAPCVVAHNIPEEMDSCGPGDVFTSFLTGQTLTQLHLFSKS